MKARAAEVIRTANLLTWLYAVYLFGGTHSLATRAGYDAGGAIGAGFAFCLPEVSWIWAIFGYWNDGGFQNQFVAFFVEFHVVFYLALAINVLANMLRAD